MAVRKYAVLDADGVKVNTITADEELIASDWYPGYGARLLDEGLVEPDPPPPPPPVRPKNFGDVLPALAEPMQYGDRLDIKTGEVTKAPIEEIVVEVRNAGGGGSGRVLP